MALETERKYLDVDFEKVRDRLKERGAHCEGSRFETNILFDNDKGLCSAGNRLARLRIVEKPGIRYNIFTVKWPASADMEADTQCKIREELEMEIPNAEIFREMLGQIGFKPVLTYEKIRESWKIASSPGSAAEFASVELDTLAFCNAVEIEAPCDAINHVSRLLDLDKCKISTTSYTKLYQEWLGPQNSHKLSKLIFSEPQRELLRKSIGLQGSAK